MEAVLRARSLSASRDQPVAEDHCKALAEAIGERFGRVREQNRTDVKDGADTRHLITFGRHGPLTDGKKKRRNQMQRSPSCGTG